MRIRSIKPEFWRSSAISSLAIEDRLLFIGLWSYVDDNGVGRDKLSAIAADLFADDLEGDAPETFARVSRGLARLSEAGRIIRYTVADAHFLRVVNWSEHQRIDKPGKPRYPSDDAEFAVIRETVASPRESVALGAGEQRSRGTGEQGNSYSAPSVLDAFEEVWGYWPKKVEKKKSLDNFRAAVKKRDLFALATDVRRFGEAYAATTDRQFVPALYVWLSRERWTDELPTAPVARPGKPTPTQQATRTVMLATELLEVEQ